MTSLHGMNVIKGAAPDSFDWSKLDEYASYLHEQDALRRKLGVQALQRKLRMDLDEQVASKQAQRAEAEQEDMRHNKLMREKADRDDQLNFERKLRDEENQRKKDE